MNSEQETNRIKILDQHTANQIAAGEVVERPFSVIKELVENAIDAGATSISVRIFDSALEKMQVTDNGCGMSPAELRMAVLRHATSKINKATDLNNLSTLGFRGEALPSIASVSLLTITSKQKAAEHGYSLTVQDGKAAIPEIASAKTGTKVLVDRLFYNAPARKKFLKTPRTEIGLISDLIARYIVAYPHISFQLINGSHSIFNSSGRGVVRDALFEAYGKDVAEQMLAFERGFLSPPALTRANRNNYNFFVNGRPARSRELSNAVDEAYFNFLPSGRYPLVFIFLQVDPGSIDVNVHPSKLEIKFHNFAPLREELLSMIRNTLGKSSGSAPSIVWAEPKEKAQEGVDLAAVAEGTMPDFNAATGLGAGDIAAGESQEFLPLKETGSYQTNVYQQGRDIYQALSGLSNPDVLDKGAAEQLASISSPPQKFSQEQMFAAEANSSLQLVYAELTPLGQFAGTFIIAALGEYLYIIDQHAAAERVLYEKIAAAAMENTDASSGLAVPIALELSYQESLQLVDNIIDLREQGFIVEHFGDNSFVIRGVPLWYSGDDPEQLLRLFLSELIDAPANLARIRKEELFMAACKQAIKANRFLTMSDISVLFSDLDKCENSATCPHGRPLAIRISRAEIYKRFLRGSI